MKSTHSDKLERYLGTESVELISARMRGWYGNPIALDGVPGQVFVTGDGDFIGECRDGYEVTFMDRAEDAARRIRLAAAIATGDAKHTLNSGFASLSALISAAVYENGKQEIPFVKADSAVSAAGLSSTPFFSGTLPVAGTAPSAAPGGRVCTSATQGALFFRDPVAGRTTHYIGSKSQSSQPGNALLLYDRLFDVAKTMNSTAAETVTGVPTRYTNLLVTAPDSYVGNFIFIETTTVLPATAHNWTGVYEDTGAVVLPTVTGVSASAAGTLDMGTAGKWFADLAPGDLGVLKLTEMQCSALVATGACNFAIGHPLALIPHPVASLTTKLENTVTAFNMVRVFDGACLSFLGIQKATTSSTNYAGHITLVSG